MAEETEEDVTKAIIENIKADINTSYADLRSGRQVPMHLERVTFLSDYVMNVMSLIPQESSYHHKFLSLIKNVELAKEILQVHISHRESE